MFIKLIIGEYKPVTGMNDGEQNDLKNIDYIAKGGQRWWSS